jgi:hypothetical protein
MTGSATAIAMPAPAERASGDRSTVAIGVWGLATYLTFVLVTHRWFGADLRIVVPLLVGLILLNAGLTATAPTWMAWRWAASAYGCFHGLMMTVLLHLLGGVQTGVLALTYVFPIFHAEMLRSDASALLTANVCALSFALLAWLERRWPAPGGPPIELGPELTASFVLCVFLTLNFVALYANRYGYQLRHLTARLRQLVAERTAELTRANEELAAKARALEEKQEQLRHFV